MIYSILFNYIQGLKVSNLYRVEGRFSIEDGEVLLSQHNCDVREINDNDFSKGDILNFLEEIIVNDYSNEEGDLNIRFSAEVSEINNDFTLHSIDYM